MGEGRPDMTQRLIVKVFLDGGIKMSIDSDDNLKEMRAEAVDLFMAGVKRVDPYEAVKDFVIPDGNRLVPDKSTFKGAWEIFKNTSLEEEIRNSPWRQRWI
jgi:hypothetical protein